MAWDKTSDYDFKLPEELIAQYPAEPRDHSRLMVIDRKRGTIAHHYFYELPTLLGAKPQHFVVNESRVIPARLNGTRILPDGSQGGKVEFFLLESEQPRRWKGLLRASKRADAGFHFFVKTRNQARIEARIVSVDRTEGIYTAEFEQDPLTDGGGGELPLPPYIRGGVAEAQDEERYQTQYAKMAGSVAAPTAGLHFTKALITELKERGHLWSTVGLHVGIGTFRPVKVEDLNQHRMHEERYWVSHEEALKIQTSHAKKVPILAVGTTSVRTLESASDTEGHVHEGEGVADLFIRPGYHFKMVDRLLTNFHLPKSSLLMLVSAFAEPELMREAYCIAIEKRYRFFSYGDAMLIQ